MATTTKNWYVLRVASNREDQVRDALERKVKIENVGDLIGRIIVPTERRKVVKAGQQKISDRKLYPGYVFVEMEVNNDGTIPERAYYLFKDTQGVGDFIGQRNKPDSMRADEVAKMLQDRYGTRVIMGAADWDAIIKANNMPGGVPKRDIVATDGQKLTLGDQTVTIIATPGHTLGTLSFLFPVKDNGKTLTVAYSGGTAFNFPRTAQNFAIYEASQKKMAAAAAAAGATILMSNHTEFDRAWDRVRAAQVPRAAGEPHPYAASL